jgi:short-subunit dehydrogenase
VLPKAAHPFIIEPDDVAKAVLKAIDRNRHEVHVPGYYRLATLAQALTPGIVAKVGGRIKKPA